MRVFFRHSIGAIVFLSLMCLLLYASAGRARRRPLPPLPKPREVHALKWKIRKPFKGHIVWHPRIHELGAIVKWPEEPPSPLKADVGKMAAVLKRACAPISAAATRRMAAPLIDSAREFGIDPFMLAALVYRQSRCRSVSNEEGYFGLTRIPFRMYKRDFSKGVYKYHVYEKKGWKPTCMKLDRYPFTTWQIRRYAPNLYFTAAFLKMWRDTGPDIDRELGSVAHRSFVSHWVWGDFVVETGAEDRILTVRRRLIQYYENGVPMAAGKMGDLEISSPLDGAPRLVTSVMGEKRGEKGLRLHRGIDIDAAANEPVRAVADGFVAQARVDLPGTVSSRTLSPEEAEAFPRSKMGPGGLFICLGHGNRTHSCYMHLNSFAVKEGDTVKAGDVIGTVGRTGLSASSAHLHFEIRMNGHVVDPIKYFGRVLLYPRNPAEQKSD